MKKINLELSYNLKNIGKLEILIEDSEIKNIEVLSDLSSDLYENSLTGKNYFQVLDIVSRISSKNSIAHKLAAISAIEDAFSISVSKQTKTFRELLLLGDIIKSHSSELFFSEFPKQRKKNILEILKKKTNEVTKFLRVMNTGNTLISMFGELEVVLPNLSLGGFEKIPSEEQLKIFSKYLNSVKQDSIEIVKLFSRFKGSKGLKSPVCLALEKKGEYPFIDGKITGINDSEFKIKNYENYFKEIFKIHGKGKNKNEENLKYLVGPVSRININYKKLNFNARKCLKLKMPDYNYACSAFLKAIETVHCIEKAIKIISELKINKEEIPKIKPKIGEGLGVIESANGLLIHAYKFDKEGNVLKNLIISPELQNLNQFKEDVAEILKLNIEKPKNIIAEELEKLINSYNFKIVS